MADQVAAAELALAREKLRAAEGELATAKAALDAVKDGDDAQLIAKAELGIAKAELGVAKAELGVAEAKWEAAPKEEKPVLQESVKTAQESVKTAQKAYNIALDAAAPPNGLGVQPGTGVSTTFQLFLEEQRKRDEEARVEQRKRDEEARVEQRKRDEEARVEQRKSDELKEQKRGEWEAKILTALETSRPPSVHGSITPSSAAQGRENEFYSLLDQMGLSWPPDLSALECSSENVRENFTFSWKASTALSTHFEGLSVHNEDGGMTSALVGSGESIVEEEEEASHEQSADDIEEEASHVQSADAREAASYGELQSFLEKHGFDTVIIGNGEGLPNRLLFSTYANSMRQQVLNVKRQAVYTGMRVYGRTDLVVLDNRGRRGEVSRQRVKLGIEVKPADKIGRCEDAKNPASREAATQLIGLNINNMYNVPPVLLTNLQKIHWVFYISDHEEYPWFRMARKKFTRFVDALRFVEECLWVSDKCHYEFGRGSSPADFEGISA